MPCCKIDLHRQTHTNPKQGDSPTLTDNARKRNTPESRTPLKTIRKINEPLHPAADRPCCGSSEQDILRDSEESYRFLFNAMDQGYCIIEMIFDDQGKAVDWTYLETNPAFHKHTGMGDVIGKRIRELIPNIEEHWFETYGQVALTGQPARFISHAKGLRRWFDLNAFRFGGDNSPKVAVLFNNITKRHQTEQDLVKALTYADDVIATLREPFLVLNHELRIKTANRAFYDAFKVGKDETENRLVYDLGNGQWDIPVLRQLLDDVLTHSRTVSDFEVEHVFPTLGRKNMLLNARPFPPDSKHPELILLAVQDVSAARERADELIAADRQKDAFLATLAHELRNPLAPIRNAVQYLKLLGSKNSEVTAAHEVIDRQISVLVHLIDDLLDIARVNANKLDIRPVPVDLAAIVDRAIETSRPHIQKAGHTLTISLPEPSVHLWADPVRLSQALANLLNNAATYTMPGGQISLTATLKQDHVIIIVRDNGIGIERNQLPSLFEPFTQMPGPVDRATSGIGLGLPLAKKLVELHGGTLQGHSDGINHGSEFHITLPLGDATPAPDAPPAIPVPPASAGSTTDSLETLAIPYESDQAEQAPPSDASDSTAITSPRTTTPRRILIVDDNQDAANWLATLLNLAGHQTRTAYDGLEAVTAAHDFRPDIVLMDIRMPKLNGLEAASRIRQEPWGRQMTLLALTGWGKDSDRERSKDAGFDGHLVKPVDYDGLMNFIAQLPAMEGKVTP